MPLRSWSLPGKSARNKPWRGRCRRSSTKVRRTIAKKALSILFQSFRFASDKSKKWVTDSGLLVWLTDRAYHCFASLSHRKVTIEKQAALRYNIIVEILLSAGMLRLFARDEGCERMIRDGRKLQRRAIAFAAL